MGPGRYFFLRFQPRYYTMYSTGLEKNEKRIFGSIWLAFNLQPVRSNLDIFLLCTVGSACDCKSI